MQVVRVTPQLVELFREKRIFSAYSGRGRWAVGDRLRIEDECAIEPYAQVFEGNVLPRGFGAFSYANSELALHLKAGRYCSIGREVSWMGPSHPLDWASTSPAFYDPKLPAAASFRESHGSAEPWPYDTAMHGIRIGNDVWIGDGAMIAPGVTIGHGAIVGARALVLKDVPHYAIVVGHPARVLRTRIAEALIPRFLAAQWWRYAPDVLQDLPMAEPERFLDALAEREAAGPRTIQPIPLTAAEILAAGEPV